MALPEARPRLPHAYPFLLVDRILDLRPGTSAVAAKTLTRDDPLLDADGVLPPVLLAEALAQAAGLAVLGSGRAAMAVLARVDRFRCCTRVCAGGELRVSVRVRKIFGASAKVRGVIRIGNRRCAAGEVVLQLGAPPKGEG